jgi:hypothetical protein
MEKRFTILTAALLAIVLTAGCNKSGVVQDCNCKNIEGKTRVVYNSTFCNDPWGYDESQEKTGKMMKDYFKNLGIKLHSIGFDNGGSMTSCYSCSCKSETRICVQVDDDYVLEMMKYGFNAY